MTGGPGAGDAPHTFSDADSTQGQDPFGGLGEMERRAALAWVSDNLKEVRRSAFGQRILYRSLGIGFMVGLAADVGGYLIKSSTTSQPLGLVGDLLYTLGWALWTGVVVLVFLQIIPEAKRRQYKGAIDAYEATLREAERARSHEASPDRPPNSDAHRTSGTTPRWHGHETSPRGTCSEVAPGRLRNWPADISIRRLGVEHAEAYRSLRLGALRDTPTAFTSRYEEDVAKPLSVTVERLAASGRPYDAIFGAFNRDTLVGIAGMSRASEEQVRHKATLFGMAVASDAVGQGIGRALVLQILEFASDAGVLQVDLQVSEDNRAAEHLYRSCGFEAWGREPRAVIVAGQSITKLHMVCRLDQLPARPLCR